MRIFLFEMKSILIIPLVFFISSCSSSVEELLSCNEIRVYDNKKGIMSLDSYTNILIKNGNEIKIDGWDLTQEKYNDFNIWAHETNKYKYTIYHNSILFKKADKELYIEQYQAKPKFFSFLPFINNDYTYMGSKTYSCK